MLTATSGSDESPQRRSWTQQVSALGEKIQRRLSGSSRLPVGMMDGSKKEEERYLPLLDDNDSTTDSSPRSVSRGREFFSSGRGGLGNIRRTSQDPASLSPSRDPNDPDHLSPVRGREPSAKVLPITPITPLTGQMPPPQVVSVGRGGVGNIRESSRARDPSRDPAAAADAEYEAGVIRESEEAARTGVFHSGRGGLGNIHPHSPTGATSPPSAYPPSLAKSRSQSRSHSRPPVHSTGRGGAGNLRPGGILEAEVAEVADEKEAEKARKAHPEGVHSTGRGGAANLTAMPAPRSPSPPVPHTHPEDELISTGRGGAGNIRSRSGSRDPSAPRSISRSRDARSSSKDVHHHGLADIWTRVTHPHANALAPAPVEIERGRARETENGQAVHAKTEVEHRE